MNNLIKITVVSLCMITVTPAQATEVDVNLTDMLTETVKTYTAQTCNELKESIKETLSFDATTLFDSLLKTRTDKAYSDINTEKMTTSATSK